MQSGLPCQKEAVIEQPDKEYDSLDDFDLQDGQFDPINLINKRRVTIAKRGMSQDDTMDDYLNEVENYTFYEE